MSDAPIPTPIHPLMKALASVLEAPGFGHRLTTALAVVFVGLAVFDIIHPRQAQFAGEGIWGFHVVFGFLAFAVVVLMGWPLRRLLSRPEDYYDEGGDA